MFPSGAAASGITFSKVIGGISKTLGIVNQAIPIYKEIKPMASKAKDMYSIVKEFKKIPNTNKKDIVNNNIIKPINKNQKISNAVYQEVPQIKKRTNNNLSPIFFQ